LSRVSSSGRMIFMVGRGEAMKFDFIEWIAVSVIMTCMFFILCAFLVDYVVVESVEQQQKQIEPTLEMYRAFGIKGTVND